MSQETSDTVLDRLRAVRSQYHRQGLRKELDEIGDELAALLVKRAFYEGLFDTCIEIDEEFQSAIAEVLEHLEEENIEEVEEQIGIIKGKKTEFESTLEQEISNPLTKYRSDVDSMQRLNQKLNKVDSTHLEELQTFLQPGHIANDVDHKPEAPIEERIEHARSEGQDQHAVYEASIEAIFEPYLNDDVIGDLVEVLVDDDDLRVEDVDPSKFEALHDSELAPHIEFQFG